MVGILGKLMVFGVVISVFLTGCTTLPPPRVNNICHIFEDKSHWYKRAKQSEHRWGSSIGTMMAIMHQESRFRAKAKPPRTKILWVIPGPRKSDSYGYSQAKSSTWDWYRKSTGRRWANRDDFGDAIDFIGWYNSQTKKINGVKLNDTYSLYLAYHEGHGGFRQKTYRNKQWLLNVANRVSRMAKIYQQQFAACEGRLNKNKRKLWPF